MSNLIVKTTLGALKGSTYKTVRGETLYLFQGVPYAKPPIGDLRFKNPEPFEPWEGIKSAEAPSASAAAVVLGHNKKPIFALGSNEDCLYLHIATPKLPDPDASKLPVMIYIHGGGFTHGTGLFSAYGPDYIAPSGVILVNINYRLGAFGFLSLETPECPGNYGLKDQSLAIRWVSENIEAFGGDPKNITIFGESAGAASVQYQQISEQSRGLFQKAIAMSGSVLCRRAYSRKPRESAILLAKKLGCTSEDPHEVFEYIRKCSTEDIAINTVPIFWEIEGCWAGEQACFYGFVPTKEPLDAPNAFITKTPKEIIDSGDYTDVPYITGICSDEAIFVCPSANYKPNWDDSIEFQKMLPKETGVQLGTPKAAAAAEKIKKQYFPNGSTQEGWIKGVSEIMISYGVAQTVEKYARNPKKTTPTYAYEFSSSRECSSIKRKFGVSSVPGTSHADDLEYLFTTTEGPSANPPIPAASPDDLVKNNLVKLFTDFAKHGTTPPAWEPVQDPKIIPYIVIRDGIQPKKGFLLDERLFWENIYSNLTEN